MVAIFYNPNKDEDFHRGRTKSWGTTPVHCRSVANGNMVYRIKTSAIWWPFEVAQGNNPFYPSPSTFAYEAFSLNGQIPLVLITSIGRWSHIFAPLIIRNIFISSLNLFMTNLYQFAAVPWKKIHLEKKKKVISSWENCNNVHLFG